MRSIFQFYCDAEILIVYNFSDELFAAHKSYDIFWQIIDCLLTRETATVIHIKVFRNEFAFIDESIFCTQNELNNNYLQLMSIAI